jgi:PAS domain S-box-containing protein
MTSPTGWSRSSPLSYHAPPPGDQPPGDQPISSLSGPRRHPFERPTAASFEDFIESIPDAVVIVSDENRIVCANAGTGRLFGHHRSSLIGEPAELLIPVRFRRYQPEYSGDPFRVARAGRTGSRFDLYGLRGDGSEFPAEITLSRIRTERGIVVSSTFRDISDRRAAESALTLANQELGAFSYSVAHDLRAPLRGMNGFATILLDEYRDKLDPPAADALQEIHHNAVRMGALVDALLALSRVTQRDISPQPINLTKLAGEIVLELASAGPARGVSVVIADQLEARMDPQLARTLLEHLLGNAWKFTGTAEPARIEFGATERRGGYVFFVRDSGTGFDMGHAGRLSTPFQRLHAIGEFPGIGAGLAMAQRIVARHGGRIWADGVVNGGATFYFTIAGSVRTAAP